MAIDWLLSVYASITFLIIGVGLAVLILFTKAKLVRSEICVIDINHDPSMRKTVQAGDTLLALLTHEGIAVPSPCGGKATCKQCRVRVVEGADEPLETDKATFTKKQLKEGWRLSCQCKVKHDISVHIEESVLGVEEWDAKVVRNENVATFIKELVLDLPEGAVMPYKSGGYVQIHVPAYKTNTTDWKETIDPKYQTDWDKFQLFDKEVDQSQIQKNEIRAYSMASYPAEGRRLMFNIRIATPPFEAGKISDTIPWGLCSSYTFSLKKGDTVHISGPYGESFMKENDLPVYFLIGGAGSSFSRSHILHLFKTENTKRKIALWYGARSLKENIYQEEYEELQKEYQNFSYHLVLSEPLEEDINGGWPKEDPIKTNFLFKAFELGELKYLEAPEEALYYVCGPPLHNKSVLKLLDDYGVPEKNIVLDDFGN